nr:NADH dehydrogenase subunit 6 [Phlebotomus chinensis]WPV76820.1 NADH dehydrogenase subunit 6 [Phlebotomus chinensis]WPV76846.1 NADH dehydrogenase subunit 6 [Phlebotomus chinensis]WPV76859.1 NADH dehydrogenase subunit 6 [Phlebotomus chinensis]WPV76872.1 NADH dehydrogenase subunit 6 [Phlebotomus chinensis]
MLNLIFSSISILTSIIFMLMSHPLAMGLMLLIQSTLVALIIGLMMKTFWFSYILFLTFLGGMLILFIYVTSLASNEMFSFSSQTLLISMSILFLIIINLLFIDKSIFLHYINNTEMINLFNLKFLFKENFLNLNKLYNFSTNLIMLLMTMYLLLTLIIIVKITNFNKGPLRSST